MSFRFEEWQGAFNDAFYDEAKRLLTRALNSGDKPDNICDAIVVTALDLGSTPPDLEIIEIGELVESRFRGMFRVTYQGDAFIVLQTKVQANPVMPSKPRTRSTHHGIVAANRPLIVPMQLKLSHLCLRGVVSLAVDRIRGLSVNFKHDPLESVKVSSTFDSVPSVRDRLQADIEARLRHMLVDDFPVMIHELSVAHAKKRVVAPTDRLEQQLKQPVQVLVVDDISPASSSSDSVHSSSTQLSARITPAPVLQHSGIIGVPYQLVGSTMRNATSAMSLPLFTKEEPVKRAGSERRWSTENEGERKAPSVRLSDRSVHPHSFSNALTGSLADIRMRPLQASHESISAVEALAGRRRQHRTVHGSLLSVLPSRPRATSSASTSAAAVAAVVAAKQNQTWSDNGLPRRLFHESDSNSSPRSNRMSSLRRSAGVVYQSMPHLNAGSHLSEETLTVRRPLVVAAGTPSLATVHGSHDELTHVYDRNGAATPLNHELSRDNTLAAHWRNLGRVQRTLSPYAPGTSHAIHRGESKTGLSHSAKNVSL